MDVLGRSGVEVQLAVAGGDADVDVFDLITGDTTFGDDSSSSSRRIWA